MSDYKQLKDLANAAILGGCSEGFEFRSKCRPSIIARLIEQAERLGALKPLSVMHDFSDAGRPISVVSFTCDGHVNPEVVFCEGITLPVTQSAIDAASQEEEEK